MKNNPEKIRHQFTSLFLLTPLLFLGAGCHQDQVQVYRVANDQDQPAQPAGSTTNLSNLALPPGHPDISMMSNSSGQMPAGMAASDVQNAPPLTWTTPTGWTQAPPSAMRVASFKITDASGKAADVSIVPLPGMAGGDIANVNRWRGQAGLPVETADALQNSAENIQAGDQPAQLYDVSGTSSRILGVIQHRDATAWFYKMTGDPNLVEQQKPVFVEFLKSLKFPEATASDQAGEMPSTLPAGHPAIGDMSASGAAPGTVSHEGQPDWQVPSGWQEVPGGQFLVAKFMLMGEGGAKAAVNVSRSTSDGGGLAANVNRWRGQLGLSQATDIATTAVAAAGGSASLVDLNGTNAQNGQPARLIGVVVPQGDHTWFYKLMGDPKIVDTQKDAFVKFVQGVIY